MVLKMFKGVWFLSMMAVMANLFYVYAGLPELVAVFEDGPEIYSIGREALFYASGGLIGVTNLFVFLVNKTLYPNEDFRTWIHGLVIALNVFFITCLGFISVYNSAENFDFSRAGIVIYAVLGALSLWIVAWPFYLIYQKFFAKPSI